MSTSPNQPFEPAESQGSVPPPPPQGTIPPQAALGPTARTEIATALAAFDALPGATAGP